MKHKITIELVVDSDDITTHDGIVKYFRDLIKTNIHPNYLSVEAWPFMTKELAFKSQEELDKIRKAYYR